MCKVSTERPVTPEFYEKTVESEVQTKEWIDKDRGGRYEVVMSSFFNECECKLKWVEETTDAP